MLYRLLAVFGMLTLFTAPSAAQNDALEPQDFLLTFVPNVQFSPVYVGIAQGYFADAGVELSLQYLQEPDVVDLVAAGQAPFGIVSGEQVILAASRGRPITYVYEWFQNYPIGVVYDSDSDISTPEDLAGQRVGVPIRSGATYIGLIALLNAAGLTENDLQIEEIGFAAPEVFCVGAIQASTIYVNNEPLQIRDRIQADDCGNVSGVDVMNVADYVDLVSNGLITNMALLESDPEGVQAIVDAFHRGLADTINNPARAFLLSADFVEGLAPSDEMNTALTIMADEQDTFLAGNPDRAAIAERRQAMYDVLAETIPASELIQFGVLLATIELWDAERLGYSDAASWETMQDTLLKMELLDEAMTITDVFSNAFVPGMTTDE